MRRYRYHCLFSLCGALLVISIACKKAQEIINPPRLTILQYIAQDPQLTHLQAAILRCHLDTVFSSGGPFTVFAPDDPAFEAAGFTLDKIKAYDPDRLSFMLQYQILSGRFSSDDIVGFVAENVSSLDPTQKPFVTKNYYGLFFNGIHVAGGNAQLGDGVVQKIGRVAFPPGQTVLQIIDSLPELSFCAAAVNRVTRLQNLFSSVPQPPYASNGNSIGTPGFTVLAPTDSAFKTFLYPTINAINQEDTVFLYNLVGPYALNGFHFVADFLGGWDANFGNNSLELYFQGKDYRIDKDGVTILTNGPLLSNGNASLVPSSHIIRSDILGTNAVIHETNKIFIP